MPRPKLTLTLAAAAYAIGTYTFGGKDPPPPPPPPPCDSYLASTLAAAARAIGNDPPPRDSYLTSTLAAVVHAIGKYVFGREDPPPPPHSCYLAPARAIAKYFFDGKEPPPPPRHPDLAPTLAAALACIGAVAVYAIVKYIFSGKDNNPPCRDPYYSSSSYIGNTTRTQTQKSYRLPPPSPSYTYQPPATNAHNQTTAGTPTIPDYDCSVHRPSVVSPYTRTPRQSPQPSSNAHQNVPSTPIPNDYARGAYQPSVALPYSRTPSQTQPSSTRIDASRLSSLSETDHVHEPPEYEYFPTSSHAPPRVPTGSEPPPPTALVVVVSSGPCTDEPVGIEDLEFAKKLREQARRKGREMSEACGRAKSATQKGRLGAAHAHRQDALARESEIKELNKRAAEIVFRENNKNRGGGMIDLHGLHVAEAIQVSKDQLQTARLRGDQAVRFIVGKGLHSDAGGAKIRPALEDFLTKRGLIHSLDPYNVGVLVVRLD
ncbi:hypothetical protein EDB84DRAFT_395734 [Lactarius hengduanensis]|nr:hypothetical protein EDB84DRAFT_395734 [Lactarius hengduanensis]